MVKNTQIIKKEPTATTSVYFFRLPARVLLYAESTVHFNDKPLFVYTCFHAHTLAVWAVCLG